MRPHVSLFYSLYYFLWFVFLPGSGTGVWVHWAWALRGGRLTEIQYRPHIVTVAETPPVLLPPFFTEVGKKSFSFGPQEGCRGVRFSLLQLGSGLLDEGKWGLGLFRFMVSQKRGDSFVLLYFILIFIDLDNCHGVEQFLLFVFFCFK